ncbi:oxidoreductase [Shinella sp. SUS2]|uniref:aldo/keto reductase n=1 Tax=unclassified Shinella TaxID=2643062 RepID=UPI00067FCB84|nr:MULTISPECIES: aldo/keto reductase [unclassified Shinella]KNY14704.1 oxidoreductase [Shinella sp. SUS2]KOC74359.1 oxidoreductase [Shinella sp. GWS1]
MSDQPTILFHDGNSIPQVGLGVWQTPNDTAGTAVKAALDAGYRHIDTAAIYENEEGVGEGLRTSGVARSEIFLTTKLWNSEQGYDATLKAFDASLKRLGTDYVDLYLIHWPAPKRDQYVDSWKAFIQLQKEGRARSIGVSNFYPEHLQRLIDETGITPVINQIELHPDFPQKDARAYHEKHRIVTQSWSPLGQGTLLENPVVARVAAKHGRTPAQVIIRWHIDNGLVVIPKSVTPSRIVENFKVFDFRLDDEDVAILASLEKDGKRIGPDPMTATF